MTKRTLIPLDIPADMMALVVPLVQAREATGERRKRAEVLRDLLRLGLTWRTERADLRASLARCREAARKGAYGTVVDICDSVLGGE